MARRLKVTPFISRQEQSKVRSPGQMHLSSKCAERWKRQVVGRRVERKKSGKPFHLMCIVSLCKSPGMKSVLIHFFTLRQSELQSQLQSPQQTLCKKFLPLVWPVNFSSYPKEKSFSWVKLYKVTQSEVFGGRRPGYKALALLELPR